MSQPNDEGGKIGDEKKDRDYNKEKHKDFLNRKSARIKNIYIELPDYEFFHSPSGISRRDKRLIGRKKVKNKLLTILQNSKTKAGAYLVTGYRGMGKTSLVREIIAGLKDDNREQRIGLLWMAAFWASVFLGMLVSGIAGFVEEGFDLGLAFLSPVDGSDPISLNWIWVGGFVFGMGGHAFIMLLVSEWSPHKRPKSGQNGILQWYLGQSWVDATMGAFLLMAWLLPLFVVIVIGGLLGIIWRISSGVSVSFGEFLASDFLAVLAFSFFILVGINIFWCLSARRWKRLHGEKVNRRSWLNWLYVTKPEKAKEGSHKIWSWVYPKSSKDLTLEIEVSLSQDDIQELDFLRLLAKKLHRVYSQFAQPAFSYLKTIRFVRYWLICGVMLLILLAQVGNWFYGLPNDVNKAVSKTDNALSLDGKLGEDTLTLKLDLTQGEKVLGENSFNNPIEYSQDGSGTRNHILGTGIFDRAYAPVFILLFSILYFIFTSVIIDRIKGVFLAVLGMHSHQDLLRRLRQLVAKIDTSVTLEKNQELFPSFSQVSWFQWRRRQTQQYPVAGPKEIEFELIDILNDIDESGRFLGHRPRFICVFDELDKIQLDFTSQMEDEEAVEASGPYHREYVTRKLRERREKISNILANLKHFLNVAKAKFVFIAGREMFDASLADISDRDFFLGSIFHDIVYVDSFLKDQTAEHAYGLTNMIEKYVCRILMGFVEVTKKDEDDDETEYFKLDEYYKWLEWEGVKKFKLSEDVERDLRDLYAIEREIGKWDAELGGVEVQIKELFQENDEHKDPLENIKPLRAKYEKVKNEVAGLIRVFEKFSEGDSEDPKDDSPVEEKKKIPSTGLNREDLSERYSDLETKLIAIEKKVKILLERKGKLEKHYLEIRKVTAVLQNFIIYLVYRSNGTPKKVTHLLEKFIFELADRKEGGKPGRYGWKSASQLNIDEKVDLVIRTPSQSPDWAEGEKFMGQRKQFYLVFDYNDQYQFSLISYLFRPYLISTSQYMKSFGDKLLFSTSFLVDHIFKFHPWAFSWRTLELTPELVFASKSPELRSFIGTLMGSLLRTHIREIVYGVFEFKFYNKTRHEIAFISKIREEESAAFNFTLDESMHIKVHFQKRLKKLIRQYKDHPARETGEYYHSLSFLHSTLGDIYYYDQEFDEALISYSESLAIYNHNFPDQITPHQLTNWMKDRLKMGLTYEKMRSSDDAFSIYEGLLVDLDLLFNIGSETRDPSQNLGRASFAKALFENLHFFQLPFVAKLVMIEKEGISGISYQDIKHNERRMRALLKHCLGMGGDNLSRFLLPKGETQEFLVRTYYHMNVGSVLYFKNGTVIHALDEISNNDRAIWIPLAKVLRVPHVNDGSKYLGRGKENGTRFKVPRSATIEYYKAFLFLTARIQAFSSTRTDAVKKLSDPSASHIQESLTQWIIDQIDQSSLDRPSKISDVSKEGENAEHKNLGIVLGRIKESFDKASRESFHVAGKNYVGLNPIVLIYSVSVWFLYLRPIEARFINKDKNLLATISLILSKFGDSLLCYIDQKVPFEDSKWEYLFDVQNALLGRPLENEDSFQRNELVDLSASRGDLVYYVVFFYLLSGQFYLKAGRHQNYEFQLRKILYLVKDYVSLGANYSGNFNRETAPKFLDLLKKELITPSLKAITWSNQITNRPQLFKFKTAFMIGDESNRYESRNIYQFLSQNPETKETVLIMAEIELKFLQRGLIDADSLSFSLEDPLLHPYSNYPTKFVRMQELNFKAQCNFGVLFEFKRPAVSNSQDNIWDLDPNTSKLAQWLVLDYLKDYLSRLERVEISWDEISEKRFLAHFHLDEKNAEALREELSLKDKKVVRETQEASDFENILIETLFALVEVIKILEIFGTNYMTSHSYLGYAHAKLGDWCFLYQAYIHNLNPKDEQEFRKLLRKTVEAANISYLEPKYHYELAVMHLYSAIGMHNNGKAYHQQVKEMFFLEDDFNDNMYHFNAAMERYKINIGAIRKKIDFLKLFKDLSKTFRYESYINKDDFIVPPGPAEQ